MSGEVETSGLIQVNATKFPSGDNDGQFSSPGYAVRGVSFDEPDDFVDVDIPIVTATEIMPSPAAIAGHLHLRCVAISWGSASETAAEAGRALTFHSKEGTYPPRGRSIRTG
jgi:hypothetical protein